MTSIANPLSAPCDPFAFGTDPFACALDGPTVEFFAGDDWGLPLTWWQTAPVYAADGVTLVTPGVPVNMTGMTPSGAFLADGVSPETLITAVNFVPVLASFELVVPEALTIGLPTGPPKPYGPRIKVRVLSASLARTTLGTFYVGVRP